MGVLIRSRNPWVLKRLRTFGCQVRFVDMIAPYVPGLTAIAAVWDYSQMAIIRVLILRCQIQTAFSDNKSADLRL